MYTGFLCRVKTERNEWVLATENFLSGKTWKMRGTNQNYNVHPLEMVDNISSSVLQNFINFFLIHYWLNHVVFQCHAASRVHRLPTELKQYCILSLKNENFHTFLESKTYGNLWGKREEKYRITSGFQYFDYAHQGRIGVDLLTPLLLRLTRTKKCVQGEAIFRSVDLNLGISFWTI